jgi:hypothetical protein
MFESNWAYVTTMHDKPYITLEQFDDDSNNKNQDDMIKNK